MLADRRPCHYAIDNGAGQIIWVPKHTPCWFEGRSGKLIVDMANGAICEFLASSFKSWPWMASLHQMCGSFAAHYLPLRVYL